MSESPAMSLRPGHARPRVSIVIAWKGCPGELSRRLGGWTRWIAEGMDVVVACSSSIAERQRMQRAYPGLRVIAASDEDSVFSLRQMGVSAASGDIVVIFDDTIGPAASWRDRPPSMLAETSGVNEPTSAVGYTSAARLADATV